MASKYRKGDIETFILFILSPFFTILFQIFLVFKGSKLALKLLIITLGLVGYIFVPSYTNDKTRYYERYEFFKTLDPIGFINHLVVTKRPDFLFEFLNYIFAYSNINIQVLFFLISTFSIYTIFKLSDLLTNYFSSKKRVIPFLLILFSFAVQHLYSGVRFTFASCILLWGIYFFEFKKAKVKGILLLLLSVATHFSMLVMVLSFTVFVLFRNFNYKYIFYLSFLFLLIPKEILFQLFAVFDLSSGYATKIDSYIYGDDFITQNFDNNFSSIIVYYTRNIWIFIAYIYLIFESKNKNNRLRQLLYLFIAIVNVFYAFPTIFSRYLILVKFIFTIYLINDYLNSKRKIVILFLGLFLITFLIDLYVIRPNLIATFFDSSNISLFTILRRVVGLEDIIDNR